MLTDLERARLPDGLNPSDFIALDLEAQVNPQVPMMGGMVLGDFNRSFDRVHDHLLAMRLFGASVIVS